MKRILCLLILGLNSAQADNLLDLYDLTVTTHIWTPLQLQAKYYQN